MAISERVLYEAALQLHRRAATVLPQDIRARLKVLEKQEQHELPRFVLSCIAENWAAAEEDGRPLCADTGLPRFYVKCGNDLKLEGGFRALEAALRRATEQATHDIPLRPNRVHPLSRRDFNNNVGAHAPGITYTFEPEGDWIDITTVHRGGLFGSDYRMLFPTDGIPGIKRFFLDCLAEFFQRGLSCPPVIVGIGLGGTKDDCFRIGQEAACLRIIGDPNPDPQVAALERELEELGNSSGFAPMGFQGRSSVLAVHVETAYAHTGGLPVSVHHFCFAARRATARITAGGSVQFREDPVWFTPYYRREGI
jgi:L(+)-tartrate dehydratase alpha subunit